MNDTLTWLYLLSCLALAVASAYMIFARCYQDGVVGKLSLGALALGASAPVWQWLQGDLPAIPRHVIFLTAGAAVFVLRHLHRFWRHRQACRRAGL